jgi:Uma2 family endonuclease
MAATKVWTLEGLHSLPDDGNTHELIDGQLYVTPPPTEDHETIVARLHRVLDRFVEVNGLGLVYGSASVIRIGESEVAPDLMVRLPQPSRTSGWEGAPLPILVVETLSPSTQRLDRTVKRGHYRKLEIADYWIVDPQTNSITVIHEGVELPAVTTELVWSPAQTTNVLRIDVPSIFARDGEVR